MACEVRAVATVVALGNVAISTPSGAVVGVVAPPLKPLAALKMWLSWAALLIALKSLSDCLEENDRGKDAATLRREVDKLRREMDDFKQRVQ